MGAYFGVEKTIPPYARDGILLIPHRAGRNPKNNTHFIQSQSFLGKTKRPFFLASQQLSDRLSQNTFLKVINEMSTHKCFSYSTMDEFINTYLVLSDEKFLSMLETLITDQDDKQTINDLKNRKLWRRIVEIYPKEGKKRKSDIKNQIDTIKKAILEKFPMLKPFIKEDIIQDNPLKGLNKEEAILLKKDKDENYIVDKDQNWLSESIIFEALSSHYLVGRLYLRVDTSTEKGRKIYREIKDLVNSMLD
jgi:hypothetical protein